MNTACALRTMVWGKILLLLIPFSALGQDKAKPMGSYGSSQRLLSINTDPQKILNTSFRVAAREGRLRAMNSALKRGAEINSVSEEGKTALIYAARRCKTKAVRFILSRGAEVNHQDTHGRTALIYASMGQCIPVIKALTKAPGLDRSLKDGSGKTALDYAGLALQTREALGAKTSP